MMKLIYLLRVFVILVFLGGCDPPGDLFNTQSIKLKGRLNNFNDTLNLGDTLKFTLEVPNTIMSSDSQIIIVNSVQEAFYYQHINIIDTINKRSELANNNHMERFANPGTLSNSGTTVFLNTNGSTRSATLNFIPKVKGVFFLEIISQPGKINVNDNYDANLYVNFDVSNKHLNIISPFISGWEQAAEDRNRAGFGVYCFRVK